MTEETMWYIAGGSIIVALASLIIAVVAVKALSRTERYSEMYQRWALDEPLHKTFTYEGPPRTDLADLIRAMNEPKWKRPGDGEK